MRRLRIAATMTVAGVALAALTTAVRAGDAHVAPPAVEIAADRFNQGADFTRIQTVTLLTSPVATATALTTIWESYWENMSAFTHLIVILPSDYYSLTVGGNYLIDGDSVRITPTASFTAYLSYHTDSRAVREGNQFRISVRASSPQFQSHSYLTSVEFDAGTYVYVGYLKSDDLAVTEPVTAPGRIRWGPLTLPANAAFERDVVLADSRLLIDLAIESYGVLMSPDRHTAQITASVINSGSVAVDSLIYVEFYDRPGGVGSPSGPLDHCWGSLAGAQCNSYRSGNLQSFTQLAPSQTLPMTFNYTFGTGGLRDLYLQVDTWGAISGQVFELGGEDNNLYFLGTYQAVGKMFLPIVLKNR